MNLLTAPLPFTVEKVHFPAPPYRLEGELAYPEAARLRGAVAIAGPHPSLGGDLNNNVVRALGDGLAQRGFVTLRFNYRGVSGSEGPVVDRLARLAEFWRTSHVADELDAHHDLEGAVAFLRRVAPPWLPLILAGYSFGCVLLPAVPSCQARILVAPTVGKHDYGPYQALPEPLLVVVSEDDFAVPVETLDCWFRSLTGPKCLIRRPLDNHFFRGQEAWLVETIDTFLSESETR